MELKPGFKKTDVSDERQAWRDCDISDLCSLQRGFDITEATRKPGTVPVYSSSGLSYFHNEAKLQPPAVITGRKGILGKVFFVEEPCWPHDTTLWVKDFKGNDPRFVSIFLSQFQLERFDAATSVPTLNRNNLVGIPIRLPSLHEQRTIAAALSDVDALIRGLDQIIAKKRDLKQAAMQQLLTGKQRLPGFCQKPGYKQTEIGVIPADWEVKVLGDIFDISGGLSASRDQLTSEGHCYLHYGDIHTSAKSFIDVRTEYSDIPKLNIPLKRVSSKSLLADGDIVFVDASEDDEGTSKHVVIINPEGVPFISGLHTIVAKSKSASLDNGYKRYCFQTSDVKRLFHFYAVGTKVSGISKTNIKKLLIPIPPIQEQAAIATVLSDMDAEIAALEQRRDKTRTLKQGMMQELLTGRIRLV
ncbi:MAG: restriction endonuclease subunit S [Candidatus Diapherotrites archaeon]